MRTTWLVPTQVGVVNYQLQKYNTLFGVSYADPDESGPGATAMVPIPQIPVPTIQNNYSGPPAGWYTVGGWFGISPTPDEEYVLYIDVDA